MRIALVHSFYSPRSPSGENNVVLDEARALAEAGHEVSIIARHTADEEASTLYPLRSALRVATGRGASPAAELAAFAPDIVHVHNLFPNIGTRWLAGWSGPLVATVHNYRYACASAMLFRDGAECTLCPDGGSIAAVRHACYRGSRLASVPLAVSTRHGMGGHPVIRRADRVIALSGRARSLLVRFGVPEERLSLVPTFVREVHAGVVSGPSQARYAAVGRLSPEKGFDRLLREWPAGVPLDVFGGGPEAARLQAAAGPSVRMLGEVDSDEWRRRSGDYTALVYPSPIHEGGIPRTVTEALEGSLPVIARDGSGAADCVIETGAGLAYRTPDELAAALAAVAGDQERLRPLARAAYAASFSISRWTEAILGLYTTCTSDMGLRSTTDMTDESDR